MIRRVGWPAIDARKCGTPVAEVASAEPTPTRGRARRVQRAINTGSVTTDRGQTTSRCRPSVGEDALALLLGYRFGRRRGYLRHQARHIVNLGGSYASTRITKVSATCESIVLAVHGKHAVSAHVCERRCAKCVSGVRPATLHSTKWLNSKTRRPRARRYQLLRTYHLRTCAKQVSLSV